MGRYAQQFKDYERYDDGDCYRKRVPANLSGALAELLAPPITRGPELKWFRLTLPENAGGVLMVSIHPRREPGRARCRRANGSVGTLTAVRRDVGMPRSPEALAMEGVG